jgi:hypothetical protein
MRGLLFISYLLEGDVRGVEFWCLAVGCMALLVIVASLVDLRYGIQASRYLGVYKTRSYGLRQTTEKDKNYMSLYFLFVLIDACLSFFVKIPAACACVAIGEILVEALSVREKIQIMKKDDPDPLDVAKAVANAYGVHDLGKITEVMAKLEEQKKKEDNSINQ